MSAVDLKFKNLFIEKALALSIVKCLTRLGCGFVTFASNFGTFGLFSAYRNVLQYENVEEQLTYIVVSLSFLEKHRLHI